METIADGPYPHIPWIRQDRVPAGVWPFLLTSRAALERTRDSVLRDTVDLTEGLSDHTITGHLEAFRQMTTRRVLDLAQAMAVSWNAGHSIGSVACARSLLETLATFHSLLRRSEAAATERNWEQLSQLVDMYMFSTSRGHGKKVPARERPPRISELVLAFIKATEPGAEQFWEQICDMAHPNGLSTSRHFLTLTGTTAQVRDRTEGESEAFSAIYNCAYSLCWFANAMEEFDLLLDHVRLGEPPADSHPLKVEMAERDHIVAQLMQDWPRLRVGPANRKGARRRTRV
jgi:hypothetical protein